MNEMNYRGAVIKCLKDIKGDYFEIERGLLSGGYLSSLDFFELITKIEQAFEIRFPLKSIDSVRFDSVEEIVKYIKEQKECI